MAADIGRNAPCPCGSGKKYKKCCLDKVGAGAGFGGHPVDELRDEFGQQDFASIEEAQAFASQAMQQRNDAPVDDFHGLSADQMHKLLWLPFDSPELVTFSDTVPEPGGPMLFLFRMMAEAMGDEGLKPTAKGNLPQKFCMAANEVYTAEKSWAKDSLRGPVKKEDDFPTLHVTRLVAEMAGLIRKYKGRFILSRACRKQMAESGLAGIYPVLLRTYMEKFNWGYRDGYPDIDFIRQSSAFTLYLLSRYGGEFRDEAFYEECFMRAFPMVVQQVPHEEDRDPETMARGAYTLRTFLRFAGFLGLVEMQEKEIRAFHPVYKIKALPQLQRAVRFHGV